MDWVKVNETNVTTLQIFYNPFADINGRTFLSFKNKQERDGFFDKVIESGSGKITGRSFEIDCYLMENDSRNIDDMYENLKKYNYARSKNAKGEWVYYFITSFNYTNTDSTTINLKIDNVTTYLFGSDEVELNGTVERAHVDRWSGKDSKGCMIPIKYDGNEGINIENYRLTSIGFVQFGDKAKGCLIVISNGSLFECEELENYWTGYNRYTGIKGGALGYSIRDNPVYDECVYAFPSEKITDEDGASFITADYFLSYLLNGAYFPKKSAGVNLNPKVYEDKFSGFYKDRIVSMFYIPLTLSDMIDQKCVDTSAFTPWLIRDGQGLSLWDYIKYAIDNNFNAPDPDTYNAENNSVSRYSILAQYSETIENDTLEDQSLNKVCRIRKYNFGAIVTNKEASIYRDTITSEGLKNSFILQGRDSYETESRFLYYPFSYSSIRYGGVEEDIKRQNYDGTGEPSIVVDFDLSSTPSVYFYDMGDKDHRTKNDIFTNQIFTYPTSNSAWNNYLSYEKAQVDAARDSSIKTGAFSMLEKMALVVVGTALAIETAGSSAVAEGALAGGGIAIAAEGHKYASGIIEKDKQTALNEEALQKKPDQIVALGNGTMKSINYETEFRIFQYDQFSKTPTWDIFKKYGYKIDKKTSFYAGTTSTAAETFSDFIRSRYFFNFVKFSDLQIIAPIPNGAKSEIFSILTNGTTFYHVRSNQVVYYLDSEADTQDKKRDNIEVKMKALLAPDFLVND